MRVTCRQWELDSALYPLEFQLSQNSESHARRLIGKGQGEWARPRAVAGNLCPWRWLERSSSVIGGHIGANEQQLRSGLLIDLFRFPTSRLQGSRDITQSASSHPVFTLRCVRFKSRLCPHQMTHIALLSPREAIY